MKYILLAVLLSMITPHNALADPKQTGAVIGIVTQLLLSDETETVQTPALEPPPNCEAPYIEPAPGFSVVNMCRGRGIRAATLNIRAAGLARRGRIELACKAVENYLACGFQTDINGRACNALRRTFNRRGVSALLIDCTDYLSD